MAHQKKNRLSAVFLLVSSDAIAFPQDDRGGRSATRLKLFEPTEAIVSAEGRRKDSFNALLTKGSRAVESNASDVTTASRGVASSISLVPTQAPGLAHSAAPPFTPQNLRILWGSQFFSLSHMIRLVGGRFVSDYRLVIVETGQV